MESPIRRAFFLVGEKAASQGAGVGSGDDEMRRLPPSLEDYGIWVEHPLD
jgi:hypothetical protein